MSLLASLPLNNNAAVAKTFVENRRSGYRVERLRSDTSLATPCLLVIDHSVTKSNGVPANRHLIQVATVESDGNGGKATVVVNLTISIPTTAPNGIALAKDALAFISDLTQGAGGASAEFDAILQNQS